MLSSVDYLEGNVRCAGPHLHHIITRKLEGLASLYCFDDGGFTNHLRISLCFHALKGFLCVQVIWLHEDTDYYNSKKKYSVVCTIEFQSGNRCARHLNGKAEYDKSIIKEIVPGTEL